MSSKFAKLFTRAEKYDPVHPKDPGLVRMFGSLFANTAAGVAINPQTAITISAFYAGVDMISKSISILPFETFRLVDGNKKERATSDERYALLNERPNRFQNTIDYRKMMVLSLLIRGRAVAEIVMNLRGEITDLIPLHPDYYTPFLAPDGTVAFRYQIPGRTERIILADEVIDIRGMSVDGVNCISPIEACAETLGIAKASEMYAGKYFGNGTILSGVAETDTALSDQAYKRLRDDFDRRKSVKRAHGTMILEEGLKWKPITVKPSDAQLLETRSYGVEEVARILQIPAYKLNRMDSVKFNTTEQQSIDYVVDTLLPHIRAFELTHFLGLFSEDERPNYKIEMILTELLRGDSKARVEYNRGMFNLGAINQNEIRASEGLNPFDGGDRYYVGVNLMPLDKVDEMIDNQTRPQSGGADTKLRSVAESIFKRIQTAEVNAQLRGKDMVDFMVGHKEFIRKCLEPVTQDVDFLNKYYLKVLKNFENSGSVDDAPSRAALDAIELLDYMGTNNG